MPNRFIAGLVVLLLLGLPAAAADKTPSPELTETYQKLSAAYQADKLAEALPLAEKVLSLSVRDLGADDPFTALSASNIGVIYVRSDQPAKAEPFLRQAIAAYRKSVLPSDQNYGTAISSLKSLLEETRRGDEAVTLLQATLAELEKGGEGTSAAYVAYAKSLGKLERDLGHFNKSIAVYRQALSVQERLADGRDSDLSDALNQLAGAVRAQGGFVEAEGLYQRAIDVVEKKDPNSANLGILLDNLAIVHAALGQQAKAEADRKRGLAILERALGSDDVNVGMLLANLADQYGIDYRYDEAEPLFQRALSIYRAKLKPDDPALGFLLDNLGGMYRDMGDLDQSVARFRESLAVMRKAFPAGHPEIAVTLNNIGLLQMQLGNLSEAEALMREGLAITEKVYGPEHRETGVGRSNLGDVLIRAKRYDDAKPLLESAIPILEQAIGPDAAELVSPLVSLGDLSLATDQLPAALAAYRRAEKISSAAIIRSFGADDRRQQYRIDGFLGLIEADWRYHEQARNPADGLIDEAFRASQWETLTQAGTAITQLSARSSRGDADLANLLRERQDLQRSRIDTEALLLKALSGADSEASAESKEALKDRLREIDAKIAGFGPRLDAAFPDFAALAAPKPVSIKEVQSALRPREVLVQILLGDDASYVWAITRQAVQWRKLAVTYDEIQRDVQTLRCGLSDADWPGTGKLACAGLTGQDWRPGQSLPFRLDVAARLYAGMLGPVDAVIRDREILVAVNGPPSSLPLEVLVTQNVSQPLAAKPGDFARVPWLVRRNPVTVLPSAGSIVSLRKLARTSRAPDPFLGFGDPVLTGNARCPTIIVPKDCPVAGAPAAGIQVASRNIGSDRGAGDFDRFFRGATADVAKVRSLLCPLPDTAKELQCVAASLGAKSKTVVLGDLATETTVKAMSADGRLARARVLHFATHGLLAGETANAFGATLAEPALVLTPPPDGTPDEQLILDDGLLTASEVAQLRINADWVVLSACNTAAGASAKGKGGQALSGLARSFFYAGARALLVSHWPVNSTAATLITSRAFAELRRSPKIGRAEALRRATLALMSDPKRPWAAHPTFWAPFVVVGEGGR